MVHNMLCFVFSLYSWARFLAVWPLFINNATPYLVHGEGQCLAMLITPFVTGNLNYGSAALFVVIFSNF